MATLKVHFVGVNAYVKDGSAGLFVLMPNASRTGKSPAPTIPDGELTRHLPVLWERVRQAGVQVIRSHRVFLGSTLRFEVSGDGANQPFEIKGLEEAFDAPWLKVDQQLFENEESFKSVNDRLAALVHVRFGTVTPYLHTKKADCGMKWTDPLEGRSLDPVVPGLTWTIEQVEEISVIATPWADEDPKSIYSEDQEYTKRQGTVELFVGNQCAEDILQWPRQVVRVPSQGGENSRRTADLDFQWLHLLAPDFKASKVGLEPILEVNGSDLTPDLSVAEIYAANWGGGGAAGCQCNGGCGEPRGGG